MLPLMAGVLGMSIASGQLISKTGRYRVFPIFGTFVLVIGLFLLSRLGSTSSFAETGGAMVVTGIGVGAVLQVVVLAAQNSVAFEDLGTATSAVSFFRSMGGAFGVAVFGSILTSRLDFNLSELIPPDLLDTINPDTLTSSPEALYYLPPEVLNAAIEAYARSLSTVFVWAIPVAVVGFGLAWFLREIPLRDTVHNALATRDLADPTDGGGKGVESGEQPGA